MTSWSRAAGPTCFTAGPGMTASRYRTMISSVSTAGTGQDTLALTGAAMTLDLNAAGTNIQRIEKIDLSAPGNHTLVVSPGKRRRHERCQHPAVCLRR